MKTISTEIQKKNRISINIAHSDTLFLAFTDLAKVGQIDDSGELANGWYQQDSAIGIIQVHYVNGIIHCETGPAVICKSENDFWFYLKGIRYYPDYFIPRLEIEKYFVKFVAELKMNEVLDK